MATYGLAAQKLLSGAINLTTDNLKASLIDLADYGAAVEGATNAEPIVITETGHGRSSGQRVLITDVEGNTAANGEHVITVLDANTYSLQNKKGEDVAGNGAYTSGGTIISLDTDEFYSDIAAAAKVAASGNLATKTVTLGIFDAADITISGVSGDGTEAVVVWKDTGTATTSPLLFILLGDFTPNGSDVQIQWSADGIGAIV